MGGLTRIVHNVIAEILYPNPDIRRSQLRSLRAAFIPWLVTINPANDKPMRRVARWSDLPELSRKLLDAFVANRLVVKDKREGEDVAEVALESLLRQWEDLADWLCDERENLRTADDVQRTAAAWIVSNRDEAWLLEGSRLAAAESLAQLPGYRGLLAPVGEFLAASRQREDDRAAQKRQPSVAGYSLSWLHRRVRIPRMHGHVVICGLGDVGTVFLRHLRQAGVRVVAIESDATKQGIQLCRSLGVPLIVDDAREQRTLKTAGVERASRLLAVTDDQLLNTRIVTAARELSTRRSDELICLARVPDPRLCTLLRTQEVQRGDRETLVDFLNTDEIGARLLLHEFPLDTRVGQPHILVANLGALGGWLVYHSARDWYDSRGGQNQGAMVVTILDDQSQDRIDSLLRQHPALKDVCTFVAFNMTAESVIGLRAHHCDPATPPISRAYVAAYDDQQAFETTLKFLHELDLAVPVVVAQTREYGMTEWLGDFSEAGMAPDVDMFPVLERTCTIDLVRGGSVEVMARAIHDVWHRRGQAGGKPVPTWDELDESSKESIRDQARDIPAKLRTVGCTIMPLQDWSASDFMFTN